MIPVLAFGIVSNSFELVGKSPAGHRYIIPAFGRVSDSTELGSKFAYGLVLWLLQREVMKPVFAYGSVTNNSYMGMLKKAAVPPTFEEKTAKMGTMVVIQFPDIGQYSIVPSEDLGPVRINPQTISPAQNSNSGGINLWSIELNNFTGKYTRPNSEWAGVMDKGIWHVNKQTRKFIMIIKCRRIGENFSFAIFPRLVIQGKTGTDVLTLTGVEDFSELTGKRTSFDSYVAEEALIPISNSDGSISSQIFESTILTKKEIDANSVLMVNYSAGQTTSTPTSSTSDYQSVTGLIYNEIPDGIRVTFTPWQNGYTPVQSITRAYYFTMNPYTEYDLTVSSFNATTGVITVTTPPPMATMQNVRADLKFGPLQTTYQYTASQDPWINRATFDTTQNYLTFTKDIIDEHFCVILQNILKSDWTIEDICKRSVDSQPGKVVKEYFVIDYQEKPFDISTELHCQRQAPIDLINQICQAGALCYWINPIILNRVISITELPYFRNTVIFKKVRLPLEYPSETNWIIPEILQRAPQQIQTDNVDKFNTINVIRSSTVVNTVMQTTSTTYEEVTSEVAKPPAVAPGTKPNQASPVYGQPATPSGLPYTVPGENSGNPTFVNYGYVKPILA